MSFHCIFGGLGNLELREIIFLNRHLHEHIPCFFIFPHLVMKFLCLDTIKRSVIRGTLDSSSIISIHHYILLANYLALIEKCNSDDMRL